MPPNTIRLKNHLLWSYIPGVDREHKKLHIVMIGNGMVSHRFCQLYAERKLFKQYQLTIFGQEPPQLMTG